VVVHDLSVNRESPPPPSAFPLRNPHRHQGAQGPYATTSAAGLHLVHHAASPAGRLGGGAYAPSTHTLSHLASSTASSPRSPEMVVEEAGTVHRGATARMHLAANIIGSAPGSQHHQHSNGARAGQHDGGGAGLPLPFLSNAHASSPLSSSASSAALQHEASLDSGDEEQSSAGGNASVKAEKRQVVRKSKGRWTKHEVSPVPSTPLFPPPVSFSPR
jgi:hypothetical protein